VLTDEEAGSGEITAKAVRVLEGVRFYGRLSSGGWGLAEEVPLPVAIDVKGGGLRLSSAALRRVAGTEQALFAVGPERQGGQRLRTLLLDPAAPPGKRRVDVWCRLPDPEVPMESAYLLLDGRPALVAVTRPADKLSFFGEKLVRLFLLDERDRSRTGSTPLLAVQSGANLWQRIVPAVQDINGDRRQDLVLAYWKGLRESRIVLDAYPRQEDGTFRPSPRSTEREVPGADRSFVQYGHDLDGDGTADLVVHAGGALQILRGLPSEDGRALVEETPHWVIPIDLPEKSESMNFDLELGSPEEGELRWSADDGGPDRVHLVDLDADRRPELLAFTAGESGVFSIAVIRVGGH